MILNPAVLALLVAAALIAAMVGASALFGVGVLRRWNPLSGSERQLALERGNYLVSTLLANALLLQVVSLAFFVHVVDALHLQMAGAMCAVGVLGANVFGYPALLAKIGSTLLAGAWLILNHADVRAYDYPLIRVKYALLLVMAAPVLAEAGLLWAFFLNLRGDVITSCCGSLFGAGSDTAAAQLAAFPPWPVGVSFYLLLLLTLIFAVLLLRGRGRGYALAGFSLATFVAALAAVISLFAPFFYELPFHHCPFCLLQDEYHHVGYLLYLGLFGGMLGGLGCGVLAPFGRVASLQPVVPVLQRRLALVCLCGFGWFALLVTVRLLTSDFRMVS